MKKIIYLYLVLFGIMTCNAQVSLKQLINTKWEFVGNNYNNHNKNYNKTWEFSNKEIKQTVHYKGRTVIHTCPFYISSTRPVSLDDFNNSLVGNNKKGDYLILYKETLECIDWYIIKSFDKTTGDMYLFRERVPDEIGGRDVTIHLKLIK
jgi:hypothetical protein